MKNLWENIKYWEGWEFLSIVLTVLIVFAIVIGLIMALYYPVSR